MIKPAKDTFENQRRLMVDAQLRTRGIRDEAVLQAFQAVPRELFVPCTHQELAYEDQPLPTKCGQTISQPYIVAVMTELLELSDRTERKILEVGAGAGYQAAILAEMGCRVISIERLPELARFATDNLICSGYAEWVSVYTGDGCLGCKHEAPFDGIIVTAAAPEIPPALIEQLKIGAKLVIPCGTQAIQELQQVEKISAQEIRVHHGIGCRFVPLIGADGF